MSKELQLSGARLTGSGEILAVVSLFEAGTLLYEDQVNLSRAEPRNKLAKHLEDEFKIQDAGAQLLKLMQAAREELEAAASAKGVGERGQTGASEEASEEDRRLERDRQLHACRHLLEDPAVLHQAIHAIEDLGVVGERRNLGIVHLEVRSRALGRPVNLEVNSPPAAGKTHVVHGALLLEDPSAFYEMTAGSERALIYLGEPLKHRILYIQEPEGLAEGVGAAAIKSLVWEGRLRYDTVVKEDGKFVGMHIEKDGPTGLIVTSTRPLEEQISTRMFRIEVDDSEAQTRRILKVIASSMNGHRPMVDLQPWHALSQLLGDPEDVEIVFGEWLSERVNTAALRIRRDFTQLLTFIGASTIEHCYQRQRSPDGRLMATLADYGHIHSLISESFEAAQAEGLVKADRKMVAAVIELSTPDGGEPGENPVSQAQVRAHLQLAKSSTSYRIRRLLRMGYLVNLETARGKPMSLVPGAPLPDEPAPLPSPYDLAEYLIELDRPDLVNPWVDPVTGAVVDYRADLGLSATFSLHACPKCFEPLAEFVSGDQGFISSEPLNPPEPVGFRGSTDMNPYPPSYEAVAGTSEGFKASPERTTELSGPCTCLFPSDPPLPPEGLPACPSCGCNAFWCGECGGCRVCVNHPLT